MIVIIASAAAAVVIGVVLLVAMGRGSNKATQPAKPDTHEPKNRGSDHAVVAPVTIDAGTAVEPPVVLDAATVAPAPVDAPEQVAAATDCKVSVMSVPSGAEIVIGKAVVGTTPSSLTLPCGVAAKLTIRKKGLVAQTRDVTPKEKGKPIKIVLAKPTFSVKVSSTPPGASITVGTKAMGFTPTTVKLPAFEASTLKISKDGFTPDLQKVTPKANNQSIHSTLKKLPKRGGR
jgi:hypothetical protein